MKALKIVVSGSYRAAKNEIIDFNNIEGIIPFCDNDLALMHIKSRYVPMWIAANEKFPKRLVTVRESYVDVIEEIDVDPLSFWNKNIKDMTAEELQDLATYYDLRKIPLYKKTSLRAAQEIAYLTFSAEIHKRVIDNNIEKGYSYSALPPLFSNIDSSRRYVRTISNEEVLQKEQESTSIDGPKSTLTLPELKAIADAKSVRYHPNIGFDALYSKLYN